MMDQVAAFHASLMNIASSVRGSNNGSLQPSLFQQHVGQQNPFLLPGGGVGGGGGAPLVFQPAGSYGECSLHFIFSDKITVFQASLLFFLFFRARKKKKSSRECLKIYIFLHLKLRLIRF
jgi:hypothetical protein